MYCIKVGLLHEGQPLFSNAAEIELEDLTLIVTNGVHHKKRELLLFLFFWGRSDLERYLWVTSLNKKLCRCEIKKGQLNLLVFNIAGSYRPIAWPVENDSKQFVCGRRHLMWGRGLQPFWLSRCMKKDCIFQPYHSIKLLPSLKEKLKFGAGC